MKKSLIYISYLIAGMFFSCNFMFSAYAEPEFQEENYSYTCFVTNNLKEEADQLNNFLAEYFEIFKNRDPAQLNDLYSDTYISGDGFNKEKTIQLLKDSWDLSSDLEYSNEIQDIRFDSNFATIEINENLMGETNEESNITKDKGLIQSSSKILLYLQKFGKGWKIISEKTLYEETSIKYGSAKGIEVNIFAPDQVVCDKKYTISLETEMPTDMFAVSSIVREPLVYPRKKTEEVFRQIPMDIRSLERVVKANNDSLNEIAVASVSYCKVEKDDSRKPSIDIIGTAILIKRVNVSSFVVKK